MFFSNHITQFNNHGRKFNFIVINIFLLPMVLLIWLSATANADAKAIIEGEAASTIGGAIKEHDNAASGKKVARLHKPGDGLLFSNLPISNKLAIRYATVQVGTIEVCIK